MSDPVPGNEAGRAEAARQALESARGAEVVGGSVLARSTQAPGPADGKGTDPAAIWGKRVGRGLGYVALAALVAWLFFTYVLP